MMNLTNLMEALDYRFRDEKLLELALRHPSLGPKNNQRLEFLGDAVLQLAVSRRLYESFPTEHEGQMTVLRQKLVCEETLADVARSVELGDQLQMDHGCRQNGVGRQDGPLSDAMEAVLAAIYLDGGFSEAERVIRALWPADSDFSENAKSRLQELLQGQKLPVPDYELVRAEGPAHARVFTVAAYLSGREIGRGTGPSKKKAEQAAAEAALENLNRGELK